MVKYRYNSLADFLIHNPLSVDGVLDDGWGAKFPVKGREIHATILFADITSFSSRTLQLSSTETLIFVNNFFAWITAEALKDRPGIVDKYIGDEIMVIFSEEFGSGDSFVDAVQAARLMGENDVLAFCPHIGIASGIVTVGFVGTPLRYTCSVFGLPVTLAARCADVKPEIAATCSIVFPSELWPNRALTDVLPSRVDKLPDGTTRQRPLKWELLPARNVPLKNMDEIEVREIVNRAIWLPGQSAEERAKEALTSIAAEGKYRPIKCPDSY